MPRFILSHLEAVEPESLSDSTLVEVRVTHTDRFPVVELESSSPAAIVAYVRDNWGDDDGDWFDEYVLKGIRRLPDSRLPEAREELQTATVAIGRLLDILEDGGAFIAEYPSTLPSLDELYAALVEVTLSDVEI